MTLQGSRQRLPIVVTARSQFVPGLPSLALKRHCSQQTYQQQQEQQQGIAKATRTARKYSRFGSLIGYLEVVSRAIMLLLSPSFSHTTLRSLLVVVVARIMIVLCLVWIWCFAMWGGTTRGNDWYQQVAGFAGFDSDVKAGKAVVHVAIPLLIAAILSHAVVVMTTGIYGRRTKSTPIISSRPWSWSLKIFSLRPVMLAAMVLLVLPWLCNTAAFIYRNVVEETTWNKRMMEAANGFAQSAMVLSSVLLMLVVRQGRIWTAVNAAITPIHAIQLHNWAGRIIILSALVHGVMHIIRIIGLGESLLSMMIPPGPCWEFWRYYEHDDSTNNNNNTPHIRVLHEHGAVEVDQSMTAAFFVPTCNNPESDCSCYNHFRILTGVVAGLAMLAIALSSMDWVRRYAYDAIFYRMHVTASVIAVIMVVLHWRKSILYLAGGLLYYAACNIPVWLELKTTSSSSSSFVKWLDNSVSKRSCHGDGGVRIVAVDQIPTNNKNNNSQHAMCVGVTMEATLDAWQRFVPGQYVRVHIPSISSYGHPFTINRVLLSIQQPSEKEQQEDGQEASTETELSTRSGGVGNDMKKNSTSLHQLRIIFRVTGPFTNAWADQLSNSALSVPVVKIEGLYGGLTLSCRNDMNRHDVVVVMAGGIGITPYLSWFHDMYQQYSLASQKLRRDLEFANGDGLVKAPHLQPQIILHWICRDDALIEYVETEYIQHWCRIATTTTTTSSLWNQPIQDMTPDSYDASIVDEGGCAAACIQIIIHRTSMMTSNEVPTTDHKHINDNEMCHPVPAPRSVLSSGTIQRRSTDLCLTDPTCTMPLAVSRYAAGTTIAANLPFALHLVAVSVLGLVATWYSYSQWGVSDGFIQRRIWPLLLLLLVCVILSYILDAATDMAGSRSRGGRGWPWSTFFGFRVKWTRVHRKEDDDENVADESDTSNGYLTDPEKLDAKSLSNGQAAESNKSPISCSEEEQAILVSSGHHGEATNGALDGGMYASLKQNHGSNPPELTSSNLIATMEYRRGRPCVGELLRPTTRGEASAGILAKARHPAVMACGPQSLMVDIRDCFRRWNGCSCDSRGRVTLYEESFEL